MADEPIKDGQTVDGGQDNTAGDKDKITFTPGQQSKIQELIDETYRKAFAKANAAKGGDSEEVVKLKTELDRLKVDATKKGDAASNEEFKKVLEKQQMESDAKFKEYETKLAGMNEDKKRASILSAVSRHNVVDADEVSRLIWNDIRVDEQGTLTVQGESGQPRISKSGVPMTVGEFIGEWLTSRPHHVKGSASQGAGSAGAGFHGGAGKNIDLSVPGTFSKLTREEKAKVLAEGIKVQGSAGQVFTFKNVRNPYGARTKS